MELPNATKPDPLLKNLRELSDAVSDLRLSQRRMDMENGGLSRILEGHMATEEIMQKEMINLIDDLKLSIARLNPQDHAKHHEFMDNFIAEQRARKEFWTGVASNIATGTIWATLASVVAVTVYAAKQYFMQGQV